MPKVYVQHAIFIEIPVNLPTSCPQCHARFEDEDENNLIVLRMAVVQGRTSIVLGTSNMKEVLDGYDCTDDGNGKVVGFVCNRCKEPVIWAHDPLICKMMGGAPVVDAARFRTLLYDKNVLDPFIKERVFRASRDSGYQGTCEACNIEADIGTREVPHPIDARLHTCREP